MCEKCILCEDEAKACEYPEKSGYKWYECPNCGKYIISTDSSELSEINRSKLVTYLFYHSFVYSSKIIYFIGSIDGYESFFANHAEVVYLSNDEIENWYPNSFNERINSILLALAEITQSRNVFGMFVALTHIQTMLLFFSDFFRGKDRSEETFRNRQFLFIKDFLVDKRLYLEINWGKRELRNGFFEQVNPNGIKISPEGWLRIDELQREKNYNKNVFVAMSFADEAKPIREAIRIGVIEAKCSPTIMDEIIHNEQIVPAMLRMIRESRLLILEITNPNYGAYYEAGYALGLGKEVIICCSSEVYRKEYTTEEEKKYERYLKPHFDVAQKQILVWDNYEDLTYKLSEWIKAIIG